MGYDVPMERDKQAIREAAAEKIYQKIPFYHTLVSAGTGLWLGEGHEYEIALFPDVQTANDVGERIYTNKVIKELATSEKLVFCWVRGHHARIFQEDAGETPAYPGVFGGCT